MKIKKNMLVARAGRAPRRNAMRKKKGDGVCNERGAQNASRDQEEIGTQSVPEVDENGKKKKCDVIIPNLKMHNGVE